MNIEETLVQSMGHVEEEEIYLHYIYSKLYFIGAYTFIEQFDLNVILDVK